MARGVAGKNSVTKYGSKSNPGKGHFFDWGGKTPGEVGAVGKCRHCSVRLKFVEKGPRGGKVRMYSADGKSYSEKELACNRKAKPATEKKPTKKAA